MSARFAPDGETIVYAATWGTKLARALHDPRGHSRTRVPWASQDALVLAISSREELALLLRPRLLTWGVLGRERSPGRRLPEGTPREVLEGVRDADWSTDGKELAVVHVVGDRFRLEYPLGRVLYEPEPPAWIGKLRVPAPADRVAFRRAPGCQ